MAFRIFSKAFSEDSIFMKVYSWRSKHSYDCEYEDIHVIFSPSNQQTLLYAPIEYYDKVKVKLYDWRMGFGIENKYAKRIIEQ